MKLFAVEGLPEIRPGDDLATMIDEQADLREGDVVCVSHTVVSKAEGRTADLAEFEADERARDIAPASATSRARRKTPASPRPCSRRATASSRRNRSCSR